MPDAPDVRSITSLVEEVHHERGPRLQRPLCRGAVAAVIRNPFAGRFEPAIMAFADALVPLAIMMAERLLDGLDGEPARIEAFGKAAVVGEDGELEHAALWHVPAGTAVRRVLGGGKALMPSTKKVAGIGARIDVPLHHKDAAYVRSHFSALEVGVPDAPRRDELVLVLAMATGGRVHARVGGLSVADIRGEDGLR